MRVLLANLKHLYQCRALWLIYLVVAVSLFLLARMDVTWRFLMGRLGHAPGTYFTRMGLVCAMGLAAGAIVGTLQTEVMSKPFSFCLPGHREVFRRFILLVGLLVSLLVALASSATGIPVVWSALYFYGVGLAAYGIGASIGLTFGGTVAGTLILIAPLLLMGGSTLDRSAPIDFVASASSARTSLMAGAVSAAAIWWWLGRTDTFRRRCGKPWLGFAGLWDPAVKERYRWARASARTGRASQSSGTGILLGIMEKSEPWSTAKYVWGSLYTWLLPGANGRPATAWMGLYGPLCTVLAWYMPFVGPAFVAIAVVPVSRSAMASIPDSPLLVAGGRRARFLAAMVPILILGTIVTLSITGTFMAMDAMRGHTILGGVRIEAPTAPLHADMPALNLRLVVLMLALFPVARLLEIRLGGKGHQLYIGHRIVLIPVVLLAILARKWLVAIPPVYVALTFVLCWIVCVLGVHRTIMRRDLGRR